MRCLNTKPPEETSLADVDAVGMINRVPEISGDSEEWRPIPESA
jgi:hypothetical protein